jgi:hypothetical protein
VPNLSEAIQSSLHVKSPQDSSSKQKNLRHLSQINLSKFLPKTHEPARAEETRGEVRMPSLPEEVFHQLLTERPQQDSRETIQMRSL